MKKKLLALVCALALTVSLVGCALSTPDTVGKIGDFEVTSGLYLLAQYDAYQQAAQLADSEQDTSKVKSFLKATITTDADTGETAVVKDYVAQKTLETLQTLAAVDARFTELGGELTEEQKRLDGIPGVLPKDFIFFDKACANTHITKAYATMQNQYVFIPDDRISLDEAQYQLHCLQDQLNQNQTWSHATNKK